MYKDTLTLGANQGMQNMKHVKTSVHFYYWDRVTFRKVSIEFSYQTDIVLIMFVIFFLSKIVVKNSI